MQREVLRSVITTPNIEAWMLAGIASTPLPATPPMTPPPVAPGRRKAAQLKPRRAQAIQRAAAIALASLFLAAPAMAQSQRSTVRNEQGYRVGTIDTKPNGDQTFRDARGYRTGTATRTGSGDVVLRDKNGFRTGRISR